MKTVKNVSLWIAYIVGSITKLPFSIVSALFSLIETYMAILNAKILDIIGSDLASEAKNFGADFNSRNAYNIYEFWEDEKVEL